MNVPHITASLTYAMFSRIDDAVRRTGGWTGDPFTGAEPTTGYVVAGVNGGKAGEHVIGLTGETTVHGERYRYSRSESDIMVEAAEYVRRNAHYLHNGAFLGVWVNGNGDVILDIVDIHPERDDAERIGRERGQTDIFDLSAGDCITL